MFAKKLKKIRKEHGWTQAQLADKIGTHHMTISRLERNEYPPSYPTLVALVEKAGVKLSELF